MNAVTEWWKANTWAHWVLPAVLGSLLVLTVALLIVRDNEINRLEGEAADQQFQFRSSLDEERGQIEDAEERVAELEGIVADLESEIASSEEAVASLQNAQGVTEETLQEIQSMLTQARLDLADAEMLVAQLTLTYSEDIDAARQAVAQSLGEFACTWGTGLAAEGATVATVTGNSGIIAFRRSDRFAALNEDPAISGYLELAEKLDGNPYGLDTSEVESIAVGCWQIEDEKQNAALYEHIDVLKAAALEAACIHGADEVFEGFIPEYEETGTYENWVLIEGYDETEEYQYAVAEKFGSIEAFLATWT